MKTLRKMDSTGDTRIDFDETAATAKATAEARALFDRMKDTGGAVFAVNRAAGQPDKKVTRFEDLETENLAIGPLAGG